MGWVNFIVVPKLKLAVETSRHLDELHDFRIEAMEKLFKDEEESLLDMLEKKYSDLTLEDLNNLINMAKITDKLMDIELDELLLLWLHFKDIKYEIVSEYNFDKEKAKKEGYVIIERNL